jgi:hypothetical protein
MAIVRDAHQLHDLMQEELAPVGLCVTCRHAETVESSRGATFWLCRLSSTDARFPKYPRLPVVVCRGHEPPEAQSPKPRA